MKQNAYKIFKLWSGFCCLIEDERINNKKSLPYNEWVISEKPLRVFSKEIEAERYLRSLPSKTKYFIQRIKVGKTFIKDGELYTKALFI